MTSGASAVREGARPGTRHNPIERPVVRRAGALWARVDGYALPMLVTITTYLLAIAIQRLVMWRHRDVGRVAA